MQTAIKKRIKKLRESLGKENIDTFMVLVEENRRYLSGFTGKDTQFDESAGILFITEDRLILATDFRYETQAKNEAPLYEIYCYKKNFVEELSIVLELLGTVRVGFESMRMAYSDYKKICEHLAETTLDIELVPKDNLVSNLRSIKEDEEVQLLEKALHIAELAFLDLIKKIRTGMTEKEVAWEMEKTMRQIGADELSFPIIVASGTNSASPHAIPTNRKIKKNEPILFDWGVKLNGYCSDISRTVIIGGHDNMFKKIFNTVFEAQQMAIEAIKPGVSSIYIDKIARDHIDRMGFKDRFGHALGHGIGLCIHELPRISYLKETVLESGMVFTVEPGIYIPEWGGVRLENMIAVTKNGVKVLNKASCTEFMVVRNPS